MGKQDSILNKKILRNLHTYQHPIEQGASSSPEDKPQSTKLLDTY